MMSPKKPTAAKKMSGMGKSTKEYGGKEKYASKSAMMKHEKGESMKMEMAEGKSFKPKAKASGKGAYLKSKFAAAGAKAGAKMGLKKAMIKKKM